MVLLLIARAQLVSEPVHLDDILVGSATSMVGLYIGDGHLLFKNTLDRSGGYYISTGTNALNAGYAVSLGSTLTLDGTWVIV